MDAKLHMDVIEHLVKLQELDRARDRLQKRLDEVPKKLERHTSAIAALDREIEEQERLAQRQRADADRAELEVKTKEEQRERAKKRMNAPKLTNREYELLQEELAGVLADIHSLTDKAIKGLEAASVAEKRVLELRAQREQADALYRAEKEKLEGGLSGVKGELEGLDRERAAFVREIDAEPLQIYERVRAKNPMAMARVDGTIDRVAGRIGNDLHCSACYIAVTPNDAVHVLARRKIVQCKSCVRILYVP
jgi:predicted  nucleic acid-binding Zn-ribbon protein